MRENNDHQQRRSRQRSQAAGIIEERGESEHPHAGLSSPDEPTAIRLPERRPAWRGRSHPRAGVPREPTRPGPRRQSYRTGGAAALAACLGLALGFALASTRAPEHSHAAAGPATSARLPTTPPRAPIEHKHTRRKRRRPKSTAPRAPTYPASASNQPARGQQAPPTSLPVTTASPPAPTPPPAVQTDTARRTRGGPFSP